MADYGEPIFQSTLHIQKIAHQVALTSSHLIWEQASKGGPLDSPSSEPLFCHKNANAVPLKEIINATHEKDRHKPSQPSVNKSQGTKAKDTTHLYIELQCPSFMVYILSRGSKHKWKYKKLSFVCQDSHLCSQWVRNINDALDNPVFNRPKHLLVFVNPYGGKQQGPSLYKEKVAPLFEMAGIKTEVITTQRANHARDTLLEHDLHKVDGVVCVGGDGMFSELLNGLCERKLKEADLEQTQEQNPLPPDIRIGIIPAGSTDCIVYTTAGTNDPVTSALHIILGDNVGLDVCSIYSNDKFQRYSVSMLAYGYYGDILLDSEKNRWMGPKRYHVAGAKKFLGNKAYHGEVTFRLSSDSDSNPRDKKKCLNECNTCCLAGSRAVDKHSKMNDESDGVHKFKGKFMAICSFTMSCVCALTPAGASPYCHLGDGTTDLMLVQECSRFNFLKHLMRVADRTADQFDFDFIKIYRVKEFSFRPFPEHEEEQKEDTASGGIKHSKLPSSRMKTSVWNCDGEVIAHPSLQVRVHCQLVKLFGRGIEVMESKHMCTCCCSLGELPPDTP
ncbi:ceramide kinase-like [Mytilus californianus]|uniref:ceramide kinase-like n=1 Tax=Mytilus californianus TaxID=6549 RepID=UPI0022485B31|nr:ceramide kinase-like [Mytilus californianus]